MTKEKDIFYSKNKPLNACAVILTTTGAVGSFSIV